MVEEIPVSIQCWSSSWKGTRDIQGETELSDLGVGRVRRTAFSQTEVPAEAIVPLLSPPSTESAGSTISESLLTWLTRLTSFW